MLIDLIKDNRVVGVVNSFGALSAVRRLLGDLDKIIVYRYNKIKVLFLTVDHQAVMNILEECYDLEEI